MDSLVHLVDPAGLTAQVGADISAELGSGVGRGVALAIGAAGFGAVLRDLLG